MLLRTHFRTGSSDENGPRSETAVLSASSDIATDGEDPSSPVEDAEMSCRSNRQILRSEKLCYQNAQTSTTLSLFLKTPQSSLLRDYRHS